MSEWHAIDGDSVTPRQWEAWSVQICLGVMPDGTVAPVGIRIEPREGYKGSIRDQRITLDRLRQFPLGSMTLLARYQGLDQEPTSAAVELLGAAVAARFEEFEAEQAERDERNSKRLRDAEAEVQQMYRDAGWTERHLKLHRAAVHYERAQRDPHVPSPRRYVADELNVSLTTVDRLLREARKEGFLEPFDGRQGKHGKPAKKA